MRVFNVNESIFSKKLNRILNQVFFITNKLLELYIYNQQYVFIYFKLSFTK